MQSFNEFPFKMKESCAYKHLWQIDGTKYNVSPPEGEDIFKITNLVLPKDFLALP